MNNKTLQFEALRPLTPALTDELLDEFEGRLESRRESDPSARWAMAYLVGKERPWHRRAVATYLLDPVHFDLLPTSPTQRLETLRALFSVVSWYPTERKESFQLAFDRALAEMTTADLSNDQRARVYQMRSLLWLGFDNIRAAGYALEAPATAQEFIWLSLVAAAALSRAGLDDTAERLLRWFDETDVPPAAEALYRQLQHEVCPMELSHR